MDSVLFSDDKHVIGTGNPIGPLPHPALHVPASPKKNPGTSRIPAHTVSGQGAASRQGCPHLQ